jgi:hypothetical protein
MSLSTREQQALDSITGRLAGSDPELAALLAAFTQLASGEEMPASEQIRAGSRRVIRCSRCKRRHLRSGNVRRAAPRASRRLGFPLAALVLWLLTTVTVIAVTLALNHGSSQRACPVMVAACASPAPAHSSHPVSRQAVTS